MCTIGSQLKGTFALTFKQCDLIKPTRFYDPIILDGKDGIKFLKFGRDGNTGSWCGVNNFGVSFVAADAYMDSKEDFSCGCETPNISIFDAYIKIVSDFRDAKSATEFMCSYYQSFLSPDILLIADAKELFYIEAFNREVISVKKSYSSVTLDNQFFVTNHFRFIHGAVTYPNNQSTYLRLQRAENLALVSSNIFEILSDQYYGRSVMSVCRDTEIVPIGEDAYFTQASSVFATDGKQINCAYILNGNPRDNAYTVIADVFGRNQAIECRDFVELYSRITNFNWQ